MIILAIGTKNKAKIQALKESIEGLNLFHEYEIVSLSVPSGVADQPISMQATIQGAKNRAYHAFIASSIQPKYSFGVESGLVEAPGSQSGFLNICVCCIYDGAQFYTGCSTGFEVPPKTLQKVIEEKLDLSEACIASGISSNQNIGQEEGLIGILSRGKVNRMEYTKESINTALLQVVNYTLYVEQK